MLRLTVRIGLALSLAALAIGLFLVAMDSQPAKARAIDSDRLEDRIPAPTTSFTLTLERIAGGLSNPDYLTHAGDDSGRLFVVEQGGKIRVIKNGTLLAAPYLDISSMVIADGEQGLLGLVFDPDFKNNRTFYIDYTRKSDGATVIARYVVASSAADVANVQSATPLLIIDQPESNHKGGQLAFGPDGYLYIGMGDGGGAGDQHGTIGNGQDLGQLLGKILRINVRGVATYTVPLTNPFTQTADARPEIWAYGLRNPWRFSFDRANGDLYISDVGQNCWEEINRQPSSSHGGENYGWRLMEGFHQFDPTQMTNCSLPVISPAGITLPIYDYGHVNGACAVIGGYVYRGNNYPQMRGVYFFGDFCGRHIWTLEQNGNNWVQTDQLDTGVQISSFGEDQNGELYILSYATGEVFRLAAGPMQGPDLSASTKSVSVTGPHLGDVVTYTIVLRNTGQSFSDTVFVTDAIPSGLSYVTGSYTATLGTVDDSDTSTLRWNGVMGTVPAMTLTFAVTVSTSLTVAITNNVVINPGFAAEFARSATIVANGWTSYLPVIRKSF